MGDVFLNRVTFIKNSFNFISFVLKDQRAKNKCPLEFPITYLAFMIFIKRKKLNHANSNSRFPFPGLN